MVYISIQCTRHIVPIDPDPGCADDPEIVCCLCLSRVDVDLLICLDFSCRSETKKRKDLNLERNVVVSVSGMKSLRII